MRANSAFIRALRTADLHSAAAIQSEAYPGTLSTLAFSPLQIEIELERPHAKLWCAERASDGMLVGVMFVWHVNDSIELLNMAVAGHARRQGVGRRLLSHLLEYASTHQAAHVFLEVRIDNTAARHLYESVGFEVGRTRKRYYEDGTDALEMMFSPKPQS
jgi:[ribosomal protein S18]-alanine N-acetyltransferase